MRRSVWLLDGHEDARVMTSTGLARAGVSTLEFSSTGAFLSLSRERGDEFPRVAIIDAKTAAGAERDIRNALCSRLVVLTTWPDQLTSWLSVGASRFLLKPFSLESLLEHVDSDALERTRPIAKVRSRSLRRRVR